jgi:hypothetical protein
VEFPRSRATWDLYAFVDLCEPAAVGASAAAALCRKIQQQEWQLLSDFCYQRAAGSGSAGGRETSPWTS